MAEPAPELEPCTASYPMTPGPIATTPERRSTISSSSYDEGPQLSRTQVSEGMLAQISHRKLLAEDLARKISGTFATPIQTIDKLQQRVEDLIKILDPPKNTAVLEYSRYGRIF